MGFSFVPPAALRRIQDTSKLLTIIFHIFLFLFIFSFSFFFFFPFSYLLKDIKFVKSKKDTNWVLTIGAIVLLHLLLRNTMKNFTIIFHIFLFNSRTMIEKIIMFLSFFLRVKLMIFPFPNINVIYYLSLSYLSLVFTYFKTCKHKTNVTITRNNENT